MTFLFLFFFFACNNYTCSIVASSIFFKYINLFIYLFIFVCVGSPLLRAFSSCGEQGLLFIAVRGLLIAVASLVAEHGL